MLVGRVGKKDFRKLQNGSDLTSLSLATSRKYKDSEGNKHEQTTWHIVNCFAKLAEIANKHVHVGDLIFVQGEIQHKKIESGERTGQYSYSVHATEIKFLPSGKPMASKPKLSAHSEDLEEDDCPF